MLPRKRCLRHALERQSPQPANDDSLNAVRPGWSPEGDRIQVGQSCSDFSDPACFYFDIYTLDLDGGSVRNITATSDIGEGGAHWGAKATTDD